MSYCRNSYLHFYHDGSTMKFTCVRCLLSEERCPHCDGVLKTGGKDSVFDTEEEAYRHLLRHKTAGHIVSRAGLCRLRKEIRLVKAGHWDE